MNERMNVSVYYKTPTIHLDNIAAIILQKTINLLRQGHGKCKHLSHQVADLAYNRTDVGTRPDLFY